MILLLPFKLQILPFAKLYLKYIWTWKSKNLIKIFGEVLKLVSYLNLHTKKKFIFIIFVIFINSLLEFMTIGAMVPFISFVSNPNKILEIELLRKTSEFFNFQQTEQLFFFI